MWIWHLASYLYVNTISIIITIARCAAKSQPDAQANLDWIMLITKEDRFGDLNKLVKSLKPNIMYI